MGRKTPIFSKRKREERPRRKFFGRVKNDAFNLAKEGVRD